MTPKCQQCGEAALVYEARVQYYVDDQGNPLENPIPVDDGIYVCTSCYAESMDWTKVATIEGTT